MFCKSAYSFEIMARSQNKDEGCVRLQLQIMSTIDVEGMRSKAAENLGCTVGYLLEIVYTKAGHL